LIGFVWSRTAAEDADRTSAIDDRRTARDRRPRLMSTGIDAFAVVICGGVAGIEGLLRLRRLAGIGSP
jgi:hypothetical protein